MSESNTDAGPPGTIEGVGDWATVHAAHPHISPEAFARHAVVVEPAPGITPPAGSQAPAIGTGMSASMLTSMADALRANNVELVKAGREPISEEAIRRALSEDGHVVAPDPRSDREVELARAYGQEPIAPETYRLRLNEMMVPGAPLAHLQELSGEAARWCGELGIPAGMAQNFLETAIASAKTYSKLPDADRAQADHQRMSILRGLAGGQEQLDVRIAQVKAFMSRSKGANGLRDALVNHGGIDALTFSTLYGLSEQSRLYAIAKGSTP